MVSSRTAGGCCDLYFAPKGRVRSRPVSDGLKIGEETIAKREIRRYF
jgi:hypothetical protein